MSQIEIDALRPGTKILFANFPADGHFNPLTGLAVHLKNQGCDVRWYTAPKYAQKLQRLQIPFYGLKRALDISAHPEIDVVFPERKNHRGMVARLRFDMIHAFVLRAPEYYEDIKEIRSQFDFELMIADIAFGAIPFVREKMHIPVIGVSVFPLTEASKDLPPAGLGLTPSYSFLGKTRQRLLRFIADKVFFAKPTKVMRDMLWSHGIDAENANIFDVLIKKSNVVLQSGTPGFEYKRTDMSPHIHFCGPLLPYATASDQKWHNEKLVRYNKVVLVTQGTVETNAAKLLIPTLKAFKSSDYLLIVTTGGTNTAALRKQYNDDNIIIEDFIPFGDVMPFADVYITNGGYGGVLLSIKHELPMVVAGVHEGKNDINARVGYFGLGVNLKTETPTPVQIRKTVETVIAGRHYADKVQKLSEEFRMYDPVRVCTMHAAKLLRNSEFEKAQTEPVPEPLIYQ